MYPEYPVEVLLVHTEEVAIVLSENNGGRPRGVCNQGQLAKVIALVERTHHTLWGHELLFLNTTTFSQKHVMCVS